MNIEDMLIEYTGLSAKRREVYEKLKNRQIRFFLRIRSLLS